MGGSFDRESASGTDRGEQQRKRWNRVVYWSQGQSALDGASSFWGTPAHACSMLATLFGGGVLSPYLQGLVIGEPLRGGYWLLGAILAVIGVMLTVHASSLQTRREKRLRDDSIGDLEHFIDPLSEAHNAVADLVQTEKGDEDLDRYFKAIASAGAQLFPTEGSRVCIYKLDAAEAEGAEDEPTVRTLTLRDHGGRSDAPRSYFDISTDHGRAFVTAALQTVPTPVDDHRTTAVPIDRKPTTRWHSFMIVPVIHKKKHLGAVSIDSRTPVRHTEEHIAVGTMIAHLVSLGERIAVDAGRSISPERGEAQRQLERLRARRGSPPDRHTDAPSPASNAEEDS